MAHYRSSLFLFACIACLDLWTVPATSGRQFAPSLFDDRVSQEIAQVDFPANSPEPKPAKPSPASDNRKSEPSKTEKSNAKNSRT
ncbi:MAG: HEAT repeat domain-containing protein, partial [Microcoleus sp.]